MKWSGLKFIIPILLFVPVLWQNFFSINPISVSTNFNQRTPWFDYLLPAGRTERGNRGLTFLAEPVYFDLRLPVRLERVRLVFNFYSGAERARVGVQNAPGWNYFFPEQISKDNQIIVLADSFTYAPNYRQRFIISVTDLASGPVELAGVEALLIRHEFYWQWIYDKTINRYKLWLTRLLAPLVKNTRPFTQAE